ncbi:MAG: hypothetical protein KAJ63_06600, partial [Methyloprofundus sp.]|nr:hypothetical protein [Methyloprofundus sp.]
SKKEAEKLRQGIKDAIKEKKLNDDTSRVSRLIKILDKYLEKIDFGHSIINDYFDSEQGKIFLEGYFEKNKDNANSPTVLESAELKKAIELQEDKIITLKNQMLAQSRHLDDVKKEVTQEVEAAKKQAKSEIAEIQQKSKKDLEKEKQESLGELQSDIIELESNIIELESKKDKINEEISSFYEERKDINNFRKVEEETKYLEVHADKLKEAVQTQQRLLSSPDLGGKMTEVKTVLDMLQGRSLDQDKENYPFIAPNITTTIPDQADQYIQTLVEFFDKEDHSITFEEVTNLLINIQQSFLTVLAGLPGTGKTSSVMRLSTAQYLCPKESSNSDCFLNVPVARGWVSSRDFVGFNNSLKGVFQPAKTGIYQFLRQSAQPESDKFLRMILLDEANLSPIEHYWSEFLAMCDKEGRSRPLDTGISGDNRHLEVKRNIRFIATINNDNTTEPLSPRLCDRVPVISMGSPSIENSSQQIASLSLDGAIEYDLLEQWFGIPVDNDFSTPSLIETFCEKMQEKEAGLGTEINISPRKKNAMTAYYEKAKDYIDSTLAIDFALSQHALPLINGHGQDFRKRLESLESWAKSNNLMRTASLLQDILKAGEMYVDSYSFF